MLEKNAGKQDMVLKVVQGLVNRYHGSFHTDCEDYYFTVKVRMPPSALTPQLKGAPC